MHGTDRHWITYGYIARAHGVRGELRVCPGSEGVELPEDITHVRVSPPGEASQILSVESVRPIRDALLLKTREIDDRDRARGLKGALVEVEVATLPEPSLEELYVYELQGAEVVTESGEHIGRVRRLLANRGQDLLEIDTPTGERLLPYVEQTIIRFDREKGLLVIRPIAGLWD